MYFTTESSAGLGCHSGLTEWAAPLRWDAGGHSQATALNMEGETGEQKRDGPFLRG